MSGNRAIRTSFMISIVGHCLFLSMPGFSPGLPRSEVSEEITVRIEIEKPPLLPEIDVMGEEKKLKEVMESREAEPEPEEEIEEIIVEEPVEKLKTQKEKIEVVEPAGEAMLRYQDMVKQRIEEVRRYPSWAKRHRIEGEVGTKFAISASGVSQGIEIVRSSGSKILDEEAVDTIKRASPFPSIPEEIGSSLIWMELSIVFTLKY